MVTERPVAPTTAQVPPPVVLVDGDQVRIVDLTVQDPLLADLLRDRDPAEQADLVARALGIGGRALVDLGVGRGLRELDERVQASVNEALAAVEVRMARLLDDAADAVGSQLDPNLRSSTVARALEELARTRDAIAAALDPARKDTAPARLLEELDRFAGVGGELERTVRAALDPSDDGSALAALRHDIERRFTELREELAHQRGREEEAEVGTRKGFDFEDVVEDLLRRIAKGTGAVVERTSLVDGPDGKVGDLVLTTADGRRVVLEAKNVARLGLTGKGGILAELDRALHNRDADVAICVSAQDAFPGEVGPFGVYGRRLLVVDDGEGTLLEAAVRWSLAALAADERGEDVDLTAIRDGLDRLAQLATRFSSLRRTLSGIVTSVEGARGEVDALRRELLDLVDGIRAATRAHGDRPDGDATGGARDADIVDLRGATA